jgi:hypothetical protein
MHLGIATEIFLAAARMSRQAVNQTRYARGKDIAGRTRRRQPEEKASAAAEVMPSSQTPSLEELTPALVTRRRKS